MLQLTALLRPINRHSLKMAVGKCERII